MSWHYLQGREAASWAGTSLVGAPDALLKLIPIAEASCSPDSETGCSPSSRSGMTFGLSTGDRGEDISMSSPEDFRARTSAPQVKVKDLPASVQAFGSRCCALLERCGLALSSRKTVRIYAPVVLAPSYKDLPAWGMTADGACWELGTSARPIDGTECGYLPTPTMMDHRDMSPEAVGVAERNGQQVRLAGRVKMLLTPSANSYGTNQGGAAGRTGKVRASLETMARRDMWPTPTSSMVTTGDLEQARFAGSDPKRPSYRDANRGGGALNPTWVELLMGWPKKWTNLDPINYLDYDKWLKGFKYEKNQDEPQKMQTLRADNGQKTILEREIGGSQNMVETQILQSVVREPSPKVDQTRVQLEGTEVSEDKMRGLQNTPKTPCAPYRRGYNTQHTGEYSDPMHPLPQVPTRYGRKAWVDGTWEDSTKRVSNGVKHRIDRLKAIGNGQVPAVVALAWRVLTCGT